MLVFLHYVIETWLKKKFPKHKICATDKTLEQEKHDIDVPLIT